MDKKEKEKNQTYYHLFSLRYHCECVAGYEGKMCETNIDDCISNACQNGAQCIDDILGYTCKCTTE